VTRWVIAAVLALALPASAQPAIRALFVGIDTYAYSEPTTPGAGFKNLHGAIADAGRIKEALRDAYGLDLDRSVTGCSSINAVSTTLTDSCATRAAIMAELAKRIDQSVKGDTLLFYYAGHGSRITDTIESDQASGSSATTLTYDARGPNDDHIVEILDREFKRLRNSATAKGVNFVTIFDSCFSRTAVRTFGRGERKLVEDGEERSAKPREFPGVMAVPLAPDVAPGSGYWVHLAAADENEKAREVPLEPGVTTRAGVFTSALAATLRAMPAATFDDIAAEVRRRVAETGITSQTPQIEGERLATLGGTPRQATLLSATPSATGVDLAAGSLSGVSEGSIFALYADSTSAVRDGSVPLASGTISAVDSFRATLRLDTPAVKPLPARLVARELQHSFGTSQMRVRVDALTPASKKAIADALVTSRVARVAEPAQFVISTIDTADAYVALLSLDKRKLARLGAVADPGFGDTLRDALEKLAHVNALLALRTDPAKAGLTFCVDNDLTYDVYACPAGKGPKGRREIAVGKRAKVTVMQSGKTPRFVYVFGIDDALGVNQVVPEPGTTEPNLLPGKPNAYQAEPNSSGRYRFVTIATNEPIQGAALQQDRAGARDLAACPTALDRLLCAAASGTRDSKAARVGGWTAIVTEVDVSGETVP
jgi:hypothetical protein